MTFIDEAMKTEQKKALIEMYYSQELSLLYILQDDFDRAKYYISNAMQVFMQVTVKYIWWSSLKSVQLLQVDIS